MDRPRSWRPAPQLADQLEQRWNLDCRSRKRPRSAHRRRKAGLNRYSGPSKDWRKLASSNKQILESCRTPTSFIVRSVGILLNQEKSEKERGDTVVLRVAEIGEFARWLR